MSRLRRRRPLNASWWDRRTTCMTVFQRRPRPPQKPFASLKTRFFDFVRAIPPRLRMDISLPVAVQEELVVLGHLDAILHGLVRLVLGHDFRISDRGEE